MIPGSGDSDPADLGATFDRFFTSRAPLASGDGLLVALSGGPDSSALLTALAGWSASRAIRLTAAHLDHGQDSGSAERARHAERIAQALGVDCLLGHRPITAEQEAGCGWETAARRTRYEFLEEERERTGSRYTVTAHHLDDQAETVLLRLLAGSGPLGLASIAPVARRTTPRQSPILARVVRPCLDVPRAQLQRALESCPLPPNDDPTNRDLERPRNRVRHQLLPRLLDHDPGLSLRLAQLAAAAGGSARQVEERLLATLAPQPLSASARALAEPPGASVRRADFERLDPALWPAALALLHRTAGARYPAPTSARKELATQIRDGGGVGCDAGDGWRWEQRGGRLYSVPANRAISTPFTYTLEVPGGLELPELSLRFRLRPARLEPWMLHGEAHRAGLALPLAPGDTVTIRNRRPGDRLQPLGAPGRRRLKEVLIDRRIPRSERDRLPLLCLGREGERIAWVPGVTVDEAFRLTPGSGSPIWLAELTHLDRTDTETT